MLENKNTPQIQTEEVKPFSLDTFKAESLQEVQNKRQEQLKIVKDNPYIEIIDNETFTTAKKHRTALVSARTTLTKEKKVVLDKVKEKITIPVSNLYDGFLEITRPHEIKQQEEVTRWEDIKESERNEKLRLEEERKDRHKATIKTVVDTITEQIKNLDYQSSLLYQVKPIINGEEITTESLEEFGSKLLEETESLKFTLSTRKETLKQQEEIRVGKLRLENERKENERVNNHKQTISDFYNGWINKIYTSTFLTVFNLEKELINEEPHKVEEFQPDYASKRAELIKEFETRKKLLQEEENKRLEYERIKAEQDAESRRIEAEKQKEQTRIKSEQDAENKRLESERKKIQEEREAITLKTESLLKSQRITALKNLGFDDDLVLNLEHIKIVFPEEDLLCDEEEFQDFIIKTKHQIENPPIQEVEDTIQEVEYEEAPDLIELSEDQKISQSLLNDFCDYCLSTHGHIDKDFVLEFLTKQ